MYYAELSNLQFTGNTTLLNTIIRLMGVDKD